MKLPRSSTRPARPSRRRRTTALAALGALTGALLLAGCGGGDNADAVGSDGKVDLSKVTLVVGDQKGTSAKALLTAAGLDDTPYTIDWKEFTSGPPMLEAVNADAIDVGMVGNTPPIIAAASKGQFKMVQAVTYTGKGDALLVPKDSPITSVDQLKGKKVGVAIGSSANYNLLAQLENAGLKYSDVSIQELQPADALAAFSSGSLDAWAVWDPYTSQAVATLGAKVLADGETLANGYNFQVAADAAIDDDATHAALADYLARITKAQLWTGTHQEEWSKVWAEQTGLTPDITLAAAKQRPVTVIPIDQTVIDSEQAMADSFFENGLIPEQVQIKDYLSDAFNDDTAGQAVGAS